MLLRQARGPTLFPHQTPARRLLRCGVLLLVLGVGLLAAAVAASAQPSAPPSAPVADSAEGATPALPSPLMWRGRHRLSLWTGGAAGTGLLVGRVREATFRTAALRYRQRLTPRAAPQGPPSRWVLFFMADVLPWVHLTAPGSALPPRLVSGQGRRPASDLDVTGVGAAPVGFQLNYRPVARLQPFISGSTGFIYFDDLVPGPRGKQLNFTLDLGLGVQIVASEHFDLTLGYRYYHVSNGFRGHVNPGIDFNLFYLGAAVGF